MAQTLRSVLAALVSTFIVVGFGLIAARSELINKKADTDYVNKKYEEIVRVMNDQNKNVLEIIKNSQQFDMDERQRLEERYLRDASLIRESLLEIKQDLRDIKRSKN